MLEVPSGNQTCNEDFLNYKGPCRPEIYHIWHRAWGSQPTETDTALLGIEVLEECGQLPLGLSKEALSEALIHRPADGADGADRRGVIVAQLLRRTGADTQRLATSDLCCRKKVNYLIIYVYRQIDIKADRQIDLFVIIWWD